MVVFVDDVLGCSRSMEKHESHLEDVLSTLRVQISKCHFWWNKVRFLGHIVSGEGLAIDPAKVVAIQDWRTLGALQIFGVFLVWLATTGSHKRFCENISTFD